MARHIKVAAAQMGPNNEGTSREEIVERMLALLDLAMSRVSDIQVDTSGTQRRVLVAFMGYQRSDDKRWVAGTIGIYTGD